MFGGSMHIRILLKQIRQAKNITLRELAEITKISKTHLNSIEKGEKMPSLLIAVTIAQALNVKLEELYEVLK